MFYNRKASPDKSCVMSMSKSKKICLALICFLVSIILILGAFFSYLSIEKLSHEAVTNKTSIYELKKGSTTKTVINDLLDNPFDRVVARCYLRFSNSFSSIQKGEYLIGPNKSFLSILKDMSEGNVVVKTYPTFTIVEGTNLAKILRKAGNLRNKLSDDKFFSEISDEKKFLNNLLKDHSELQNVIGKDISSLEGLISPATYPLYEKSPFYSIFKSGVISQLKALNNEWKDRDKSNNIKSPYEALILASLIEKETFLDEERTLIAAVFENRLTKGMRLQTDPTVMYGISKEFTGTLKKSHLKKDTPYNTYTRDGLPPTPICMPQVKSIHAALHPEKSDALYFVAKDISPTYGHVFSSSLKEHNKAVYAYRKKVKAYKINSVDDSDESDIETENENIQNKDEAKSTLNQKDSNEITKQDSKKKEVAEKNN